MNFKRYSYWVYLFCLYCVMGYSSYGRADTQKMTLAYLEAGLKDLNDADRHAALQLLSKELTRNSEIEFNVISLKSMSEILALMQAGKINYLILNSYLFLTDRQNLQPFLSDELWAIQRAQEAKENYVLVVSNDSNYKNISSLSGKSISMHKDYLLQTFYLNYLVKKQTRLPVDQFFKRIKDTRTDTQAVLDVFFKTSDSCLVPEYVVDLVADLNPAVLQGVRVVHQSGADFIPALVLTVKDNPVDASNIIKQNLLTLADNPRGQEILNLFSINSIIPSNTAALQKMIEIYDDYLSITGKN